MHTKLEAELATIPAGDLMLGDTWQDGDPDEVPTHAMTVAAFAMSKTTVPNGAFLDFLNDRGDHCDNQGEVFFHLNHRDNPIHLKNGHYTCHPTKLDHPVTCISWQGAQIYCQWLTEKTERLFRLPTEAEWQYAAMGPRQLKWSLGDSFEPGHYVRACAAPAASDDGIASDWGLVHMTGNVFEWCADEYGFKPGATEDLLVGHRVIKGGSFILNDATNFRNAKRFSCFQKSCLFSIGFRIVAQANT